MFNNLINIIVAPSQTFQSIKEKPSVLFPYLLLILVLILTQFVVLNLIDFDYFLEDIITRQAAATQTPESELRQGMAIMTPTFMAATAAISIVIVLSLIFCIYAAYLNLIAKLGDDRYRFKHFFSLMVWTSMPMLLSSVASILNVMLNSNRQFTQTQLDPLSLNNLFFHASGPSAAMLNGINLAAIWSAVLLVLGYRYLTGSSLGKAAVITLAPFVVIYGGWAVLIAVGNQ